MYIDSGNFKQAVSTLRELIEETDVLLEDLAAMIEEEPTYADFTESVEYKNWKKQKN
ncbi:MAG: hypothetical protein HEP71_30745 [Roseivirga sp.]|nr:hypothetical protein [Roseivirga sp.]